MKEIKVKLYADENDSFVELWKVIDHIKGEPLYYGRFTFNNEGTWYYVSDPLGYCELSHTVKEDVMFILCDDNGNECARYSNADKNPLPTFDTVMKAEWKEFCKNITHNTNNMDIEFWVMAYNGETTLKINQWLLTFKDPDLYKKEIDGMYGYDENWVMHTREIGYEPIEGTEFEYLGQKYQFTKVLMQHEVCGVEWIEYVCTTSPYCMEDTPWIKDKKYISRNGYLGDWFDVNNVGTMLDIRTARKMVEDALVELYPKDKEWRTLLYVVEFNYSAARYGCYEKSYHEVAEALINRELHRDKVLDLIENLAEITKDKVFYCNGEGKKKVLELYPDIYGYDYCLI